MPQQRRNIAVLGATGSIGRNTLEVIQASAGELQAVALTGHQDTARLLQQAQTVRPRWLVVSDAAAAAQQDWSALPRETELLIGPEAVERVAAAPEVDVVLSAIVGSAGLRGTWAAVAAGKTIALANKETLVVAGPLVVQLAKQSGALLLPVDSEHSAVFQALQSGRREEVQRILLTASGGPFRNVTLEQMQQATVAQALAHPTWSMGRKITIDSATMMNKALEIIEARWLFGLAAEQIDVVVHPQSIVHSLVEFVDGSVLAQLSPPDMKLPIHYALYYPQRRAGIAPRLNLAEALDLRFEPPDEERFPALQLGREAARAAGTAGAVLNAANEAAVARFLAGELQFTQIAAACRAVLENHAYEPQPSLETLLASDRWAREQVQRWKAA